MVEAKQKKDKILDLGNLFQGQGFIKAGMIHHIEFLILGFILLFIKLLFVGGILFLLIFLGMNSAQIMISWYSFWGNFKLFKKKKDKENEIKESLITQTIDKELSKELDEVNKKVENGS